MILTLAAFFSRDARRALSYRLAFLLDLVGVVFKASTFYFVARLIGTAAAPQLQEYGGQYFPFVLIGIAFASYQTVGLNAFAQSLRQEQFMGTLESVLCSPVRLPMFLAGSALWDFFYATIEIALYFLVAFVAFGLTFTSAALGPALVSALLTLTAFMGLGVLSAAFILRFKRGDPVAWLIASVGELFGGEYFPVRILPDRMQTISHWIPMTHALDALRKTLMLGAGFADISPDLIYLGVFTLLVWPIGVFAFQFALRRSQADGSLGHY